jgi:EmrB/QacA subfamily drug resistance transporter
MPDDGPDVRRPGGSPGPRVQQTAEHVDPSRRTLILIACLIATFMAAVESSIVATAIPTLVGDLGGFALFSWVFTIYLLTQAVSIPIYGRLADLYGRKKIFFVGAGLFLIGSTLCGLAWNMVALICFRAIQGFGAGGVQPIAATILGDVYTPTERAKVQGLVSSVFGVSAVIGPSLGAFLIQHWSWSVVFWVNIPIGLLSMLLIALFLPETIIARRHKIDWLGSLLLLVAVSMLMLGLVQGGTLGHAALAGIAAIGVMATIGLFLHERAISEPMLPLELWRNRVIVVGSLGNGTAGAMMMGVSAFLPTYVQGTMGESPLIGGLVLGAMSVSWALFSLIGGRIMVRTSYRLTATIGGSSLVAGCLLLVLLPAAAGPLWAAFASFVIGIGMGFCTTTFIVSVQASVAWHQRGAATSSTMFLRFIGQAVGAAGCGAVLNAAVLYMDPAAVGRIATLLDPVGRAGLDPASLAHLTGVLSHGLHTTYLLALGFAGATLAIASRLPARLGPRDTQRG